MEQSEFGRKLAALRRAVDGWQALQNAATDGLTAVQIDGIQNGLLQKFEYSWEMMWKTCRKYLLEIHAEETNFAKVCIQKMFLLHKISEADFTMLEAAQKDRNLMSHIYDEAAFKEILGRLPQYLEVIKAVLEVLEVEYDQFIKK